MPVTKKIMQQYENVRRSGMCNMFNYGCVTAAATALGLYALGAVTIEEYKDILMNFGKYMKKFDIKQNIKKGKM